MSKIRTYTQDLMPDDRDKVLGTRSSDNRTSNYTLLRIAQYMAMNGYADPARNAITLKFDVLEENENQPTQGSAIVTGNRLTSPNTPNLSLIHI